MMTINLFNIIFYHVNEILQTESLCKMSMINRYEQPLFLTNLCVIRFHGNPRSPPHCADNVSFLFPYGIEPNSN